LSRTKIQNTSIDPADFIFTVRFGDLELCSSRGILVGDAEIYFRLINTAWRWRMCNKHKLVLFDIDGTLLDAGGAGRRAFAAAFETSLGWKQDIAHINFAGATDLAVFRQLLRERGIESTPELESSYFSQLPLELQRALAETPAIVFPGVRSLLERLGDMDGVRLGIVTGNVESTAWVKLEHAGLREFFTFGGFGCDHADRVVICRQAMERGGLSEGLLFGDTPNDVKAALANGLTSVAVASKHFTVAELQTAGAHHVFENFSDTNAVLRLLS
jgi:phosphoglycolate phosphatase-like HAD superfamily hydrolase